MATKNNKVILTICDQSLSNSLSRAINARNSDNFQLINISPLEFLSIEAVLAKLEQFKDKADLKGIILTDYLMFSESNPDDSPGIDLIKHIRLTKTLGNLCSLPIVLLSLERIMHHLRTQRDNIILLSPGCYPIQVSFRINEFVNTLGKLKYFKSIEEMREEINEFIVWSKKDDIVSQHDNFNRYGPFKLLKEHYGEIPRPMSEEYKKMAGKLWFKKSHFIEKYNEISRSEQYIDDQFKKIISDKRILYIDDEHRLGWSFALYSIFSDKTDDDIYQKFQSNNDKIETPEVICIDNFNTAIKEFESFDKRLKAALEQFANGLPSANLQPFDFHLVILDLRLEKEADRKAPASRITGIRLLNKIKNIDPSIPVIVFTASEKALNYEKAIDIGASEYWIKVRNSASDLKSKIIECLVNIEEIKKLWLDIKKVEVRKKLACFYEINGMLQEKPMDQFQKKKIVLLLKESFLLLQRKLSHYEKSVCNYTNYSKIAMNMGLIQEERLINIREEKFKRLSDKGIIPQVEKEIRRIRNDAVHQRGIVDFKRVLDVFQKTLECCLIH